MTIKDSVVSKGIRVNKRLLFFLTPSLLLSILWLVWATSEEQSVLLPALIIINTALWLWLSLWNRDRQFPLFDLGAVCMMATAIYVLLPLLGFLLSEMNYTPFSAIQLYALQPNSEEIGNFAWFYVVYFGSFAVTYFLVREGTPARKLGFHCPDPFTIISFLILVGFISVILFLFEMHYGVKLNPTYDSSLLDNYFAYLSLPLLQRQIIHHLQSILFLLKMGLMTMLVSHWNDKRWRYLLLVWLFTIAASYLLNMGARTEAVLFFGAFLLTYHQMVKPLNVSLLAFGGMIFLMIFLLIGMMRGGSSVGENLLNLNEIISEDSPTLFSFANEFQVLFGGTFDLFQMKTNGVISDVPWQVRLHEILLLIPQQILPFEKIDPQSWYLGLSPNPGFLCLGPLPNLSLGGDGQN